MNATLNTKAITFCTVVGIAQSMSYLAQFSFYAAMLVPVVAPTAVGLLVGMPAKAKKGKVLKFPMPKEAKNAG